MMRPRKYGTLNRSMAKAIGHCINQNYRRNNNNNNNRKSNTSVPSTPTAKDTGIGILILVVMIALGFIFPSFGIFKLVILFFIAVFH